MSEHSRPTTVPLEAEFFTEGDAWALGPRDAEGRRTGLWKSWRRDGSFSEEAMFEAGRLHGPRKRFYEDGSVACVALHEHGQGVWLTCLRPTVETAESHPFGGLDEKVQTCKFLFAADGFIRHQSALTAQGVEVSAEGVEAPPRPPGVPEHANFVTPTPGQEVDGTLLAMAERPSCPYWEVCEFAVVDSKRVHRGVTRTYALAGDLQTVAFGTAWVRMAPGADPGDKLGSGNPLIAAAQAGDEAAVELLFTLGLQHTPGAALHAAIEGLPALARRIRDDSSTPAFQDPRQAGRPAVVPPSALWVPGLDAFVDAKLTPQGQVDGQVQLWKDPQGDLVHTRITFEQGSRVRQVDARAEDALRETQWEFFTDGPHRGRVRLERHFVDGVVETETESWPEQARTAARVFEDGRKKGERIEEAGALVRETWWKEGARVAVVVPWDETAWPAPQARQGAEFYQGFDGDTLVAEGLAEGGFYGKPFGLWRVHADGQVIDAPFTKLEGLTMAGVDKRDAGAFAGKLARWVQAPTPPWFAEIAALDWDRHGGWFSSSEGALVPFLLAGLVLGDAEVFDLALQQLENDVLHQATLSEASGPVLTTMLKLLPQADAQCQAGLIYFLSDVIHDCGKALAAIEAVGGGSLLGLMAQVPFTTLAAQAVDRDVAELATEIGAWVKERACESLGAAMPV
jgi:hypothetical protein